MDEEGLEWGWRALDWAGGPRRRRLSEAVVTPSETLPAPSEPLTTLKCLSEKTKKKIPICLMRLPPKNGMIHTKVF